MNAGSSEYYRLIVKEERRQEEGVAIAIVAVVV
jgi:hypothetical protein